MLTHLPFLVDKYRIAFFGEFRHVRKNTGIEFRADAYVMDAEDTGVSIRRKREANREQETDRRTTTLSPLV